MAPTSSRASTRPPCCCCRSAPEVATEVFRHLDEGEVRRVTKALARMRTRRRPSTCEPVEQDYREARRAGSRGLRVDGLLFARALVSQTPAAARRRRRVSRDEILAELEQLPSGESTGLARALEGVPPDGLARLLETEHPQIATLILAHLDARAGDAGAARPAGGAADRPRRAPGAPRRSDPAVGRARRSAHPARSGEGPRARDRQVGGRPEGRRRDDEARRQGDRGPHLRGSRAARSRARERRSARCSSPSRTACSSTIAACRRC